MVMKLAYSVSTKLCHLHLVTPVAFLSCCICVMFCIADVDKLPIQDSALADYASTDAVSNKQSDGADTGLPRMNNMLRV